jgi:NADPH:quinone reductase-like Zn-dependent oxidoreductase
MKAVEFAKYGPPDVLRLVDVAKPTPGHDELLVKIAATSVTPADWRMRKPEPFLARFMNGIIRPVKLTRLGTEFSGTIESVGSSVRRFKAGDDVFGSTYDLGYGAYAEYKCVPESSMVAIKPSNITYEEAAVVPTGAKTALHFLRDKGNIQSNQRVLINGASGSIGTYAVQLATYFGADVTGVCGSTNIELVRSLGAGAVIDYKKEDFTRGDRTYDLIFDAVGKSSFTRCRNSLTATGIYLFTFPTLKIIMQMRLTSKREGKKAIYSTAPDRVEDLTFLKELLEAEQLRAVIDRQYSLEQTADAHRYVEQGHKAGNVVITVG